MDKILENYFIPRYHPYHFIAYLGKVKDSRICDTLESSFDVFSVLSLLVDFNPSAIIDPLKDIKQKLRILGALDHLRDKMLSLLLEVTE